MKPHCINGYIINDTLIFLNLLTELPLSLEENDEYALYYLDSRFTSIPLKVTIDYIIKQMYTHKKLKPMCSKLIFSRLLCKMTTDCTFQLNSKLYEKIKSTGGPPSVTGHVHDGSGNC